MLIIIIETFQPSSRHHIPKYNPSKCCQTKCHHSIYHCAKILIHYHHIFYCCTGTTTSKYPPNQRPSTILSVYLFYCVSIFRFKINVVCFIRIPIARIPITTLPMCQNTGSPIDPTFATFKNTLSTKPIHSHSDL